jgi:hypothetical protein
MAKKKTGKDLAVKGKTAPAKTGDLFQSHADEGFEGADKDSYAIPFLAILQSNSPQCKKSDGAYIKGAEEGEIFNTVTLEHVESLRVIPCYYSRSFIEWGNRDEGGGFVAEYTVDEGLEALSRCKKNDKGQDQLENGNILVDTRSHFVIILKEDGTTEAAILSMSSTQMKKSKQWMSIMKGIQFTSGDGKLYTPPMFSHIYNLTTVPESNDKGSWMGWKVEIEDVVKIPALVEAAVAFKKAVQKGSAKADHSKAAGSTTEDEDF